MKGSEGVKHAIAQLASIFTFFALPPSPVRTCPAIWIRSVTCVVQVQRLVRLEARLGDARAVDVDREGRAAQGGVEHEPRVGGENRGKHGLGAGHVKGLEFVQQGLPQGDLRAALRRPPPSHSEGRP